MSKQTIWLISGIIFLPLVGFASYLYVEQRVFSRPVVEVRKDSVEVNKILNNEGVITKSPEVASSSSPIVKQATLKTSVVQPKVEGNNVREQLLSAVRAEPFFDPQEVYPAIMYGACTGLRADSSKESLTLSSGIYISVEDEFAHIHAYDQNGGHTGLTPKTSDMDFEFPEEGARGSRIQFIWLK